jgi:hypothetical protein
MTEQVDSNGDDSATCILEVPGLNLGQDINYPDWGVLVLFSVLLGKYSATLN